MVLAVEDTMIDVCNLLRAGGSGRQLSNCPLMLNVLSNYSVIRVTPTIKNVFLFPNASIQAAASVTSAVLLPESTIGNSCVVSNVLLQWNAAISDNSSISETLLMEQAHAGPHSFVASSVLGPDVHVSAGEIHASIIGMRIENRRSSLNDDSTFPNLESSIFVLFRTEYERAPSESPNWRTLAYGSGERWIWSQCRVQPHRKTAGSRDKCRRGNILGS